MPRPETFQPGDRVLVPLRQVRQHDADRATARIDGHWGDWEVLFDPAVLIDGCLPGVVREAHFPQPHTELVRLTRFTTPEPNGLPMTVEPLRSGLRLAAQMAEAA